MERRPLSSSQNEVTDPEQRSVDNCRKKSFSGWKSLAFTRSDCGAKATLNVQVLPGFNVAPLQWSLLMGKLGGPLVDRSKWQTELSGKGEPSLAGLTACKPGNELEDGEGTQGVPAIAGMMVTGADPELESVTVCAGVLCPGVTALNPSC